MSPPAGFDRTGCDGEATPLYGELVNLWAARGATLPGAPDPDWRRLVSYRHFQEETEETLRMLRLQGSSLPLNWPNGQVVPTSGN